MPSVESVVANIEIKEFADLVSKGVEMWIRAGLLYVKMVDADPDVSARICAQYPDLTLSILARFEQIGRRQIHPRLLMLDGPGYRRLRRMPYSVQEKHISEPVRMLCPETGDHLNVSVRNMSKEAAEQVFAGDHVRDDAEQRAYIEAKRSLAAQTEQSADMVRTPWKVKRGRLMVTRPCEMTRQELVAILGTMS